MNPFGTPDLLVEDPPLYVRGIDDVRVEGKFGYCPSVEVGVGSE